MLYILGHEIEVTTEKICFRSNENHATLKAEARAARIAANFNIQESHVLCLRCGKAISLAV